MTRRKNTKRIDPRYFLNETAKRHLDEQSEESEEDYFDAEAALGNRLAGLRNDKAAQSAPEKDPDPLADLRAYAAGAGGTYADPEIAMVPLSVDADSNVGLAAKEAPDSEYNDDTFDIGAAAAGDPSARLRAQLAGWEPIYDDSDNIIGYAGAREPRGRADFDRSVETGEPFGLYGDAGIPASDSVESRLANLREDEDINEADWKPGKVTPGGSQGAYAASGGRGGLPGKPIPQGDVQKIAAATTAGHGETADKDIDDIRRSGAKEFGLAGKRESLTRSRLREMVMEELKNLK